MLVPVYISRESDQTFLAIAPDFPGCTARGSELGRTITRIHLKLEGRVSDMLIRGEPLPAVSEQEATGDEPVTDAGHGYQIHINLVHLAAVARHQTRRGPAPSD